MLQYLFLRLTGVFLPLTLLIGLLFIEINRQNAGDQYVRNRQAELKRTMQMISNHSSLYSDTIDSPRLLQFLTEVSVLSGYKIWIFYPGNQLLFQGPSSSSSLLTDQARRLVRVYRTGENTVSCSLLVQQDKHVITCIKSLITCGGDNSAVCVLSTSVTPNPVLPLYTVFLLAPPILLACWLLAVRLNRSCKLLAESSDSISGGSFQLHPILSGSKVEIFVQQTLRDMAGRLQERMEPLREKQQILESILESLEEGLCVISREGKLTIFSNSFQNICPGVVSKGKTYWELLRNKGLSDFVDQVAESGNPDKKILEIDDQTYLCSASHLEHDQQILLLFYNITEIKKLERMKKDLVLNVSHELKTPLTSMKGFIETMRDDTTDPEQLHYIEVIERNTNRLIRIVQDLLLLSTMEENANMDISTVSLPSLIQNAVMPFEKKIADRNLELQIRIEDNVPNIEADDFKLEQALINLLQNAIQYTERGFIRILVLLHHEDQVRIVVEDSGSGIASHHIPQLFNRFYVVDKSRSRKYGGTGLGLSIVKHIVLRHHGVIAVNSVPGKGTSFFIDLPIHQPDQRGES